MTFAFTRAAFEDPREHNEAVRETDIQQAQSTIRQFFFFEVGVPTVWTVINIGIIVGFIFGTMGRTLIARM